MNPPFHPPSVCPSANLSPFHLPHTETRQWGPHPSSIFTTFMPPLGHSLTTGAPVSVFCTSFPHLFIILLYQHLLFPPFVFGRHRWRPAFLFGHTQPMSPLVGASLFIYPHRHRLCLQSTTQVFYHLSSEFTYLVPPLAQLTSDLVVPMTLDLVPTVAATPSIMHPPTKGSLESSHFLTSPMYPCHLITSVDSHGVPFCS
jgi:hypothetical protein